MFAKFWQHYPQGSLTSTLVTVDRGMYVVRALVQVNDKPIASGLGAAATIEAAEDQARERALAVLEFGQTAPPPSPSSSIPEVKKKLEVTPTPPPKPVEPSPEDSDNGATPPVSSPQESPPEDTSTVVPLPETPTPAVQSEVTQPEAEPEPEPTTMTNPPVEAKEVVPAEEPEPEPEPTSSVTSASPPIDFSDVIARTNVELKRLNWTTEQGKDYLLQTYGKRSRQLLTDDELLEFLQYLESIPNS